MKCYARSVCVLLLSENLLLTSQVRGYVEDVFVDQSFSDHLFGRCRFGGKRLNKRVFDPNHPCVLDIEQLGVGAKWGSRNNTQYCTRQSRAQRPQTLKVRFNVFHPRLDS